VLPVTDTSVRVEQPATAQHKPAIETASATGIRFMETMMSQLAWPRNARAAGQCVKLWSRSSALAG
jgi:hypothetical protein